MQTSIDDKREKSISSFAPASETLDLKVKAEENCFEVKKTVKVSKNFSSDEKKTNECVSSHFLKPNNVQQPKSISIHTIKQIDDDSLRFLWQDAKWFLRYVKMEAEMVSMEVKTTREIEAKKERWIQLKQAFHDRLEILALKREKNQ